MSYKEKRERLSLSKLSSSDSPYITGNQKKKEKINSNINSSIPNPKKI